MTSLAIPAAVLEHAQRQADAFGVCTGVSVDAVELLTGRAALLDLAPVGRISAGGATHLMAAVDGWCAVTLSRAEDVDTVPALIESDDRPDDPWPDLHDWVSRQRAAEVTARARLLGLPAASLGEAPAAAPRVRQRGEPTAPRPIAGLLVADLSSMWAGPLCGQLLVRAGATVVKVESPRRPDGTRSGPPAFFDWMNCGKLSYAVDLDQPEIGALLAAADVVIEGSRPAGLVRHGLGPGQIAARPGAVWVRITGYGADGERAEWVAFGDDAAVAGGLVGSAAGEPVFCGDAIADPLSGVQAALAVVESLHRGGGELIEMSMAAVAATYAELVISEDCASTPATTPPPSRAAPALGADNAVVERLVAERLSAAC